MGQGHRGKAEVPTGLGSRFWACVLDFATEAMLAGSGGPREVREPLEPREQGQGSLKECSKSEVGGLRSGANCCRRPQEQLGSLLFRQDLTMYLGRAGFAVQTRLE